MYSKVILLGRIAQDLCVKTTPGGKSVLSFAVACDRRYQEKGKEKKSDFFSCVAWNSNADFIARYWAKGKPILIEGELQSRSYSDKDGITRYVTEVIVDRAAFTGDSAQKPQGTGTPPPEPPAAQQNKPAERQYTADDFKITEPTDDDYPF